MVHLVYIFDHLSFVRLAKLGLEKQNEQKRRGGRFKRKLRRSTFVSTWAKYGKQ